MEALAFVLALGFLSLTSAVDIDVPPAAVQEEQTEVPEHGIDLRRQRIMITNQLFREIRLAGLPKERDEGPEKVLVAQR